MIMEEVWKKADIADLLVIYGKLLTEVVYRRMENFYLDDLSYSEIAKNEKVSRTAIYESIHEGEKDLVKFESKLGLYQRLKKLRKMFYDLESTSDHKKQQEILNKIQGEIEYGI